MSDKIQKDISKKRKLIVVCLGFVIGIALLIFSGGESRAPENEENEFDVYAAEISKSLEELCKSLLECDVNVFVSFESGFAYNYALDSRGGVVTVGSGSSETALISSVTMPKIAGVGIVYGGNLNDESEILELISSALGIGKNKIYITCAKNG